MRCANRLTLDLIRPSRPPRDARSSALNGNRPRPRLLGELAGADGFRTGISQAGPGSSGRCPQDSVANVSQIVTLDRALLAREVGKLSKRQLDLVLGGIDIVLGR
jgi:PemK-like, MazF-like toxin of type II toxin-antitoxin system